MMVDRKTPVKFPAHIRIAKTKAVTEIFEQSSYEHCLNVSLLSKAEAKSAGLASTAELIGLLHDAGKFTSAFTNYIRYHQGQKGSIHHAPVGAIFAYERWFIPCSSILKNCTTPKDFNDKNRMILRSYKDVSADEQNKIARSLAAQMISMVIRAHHAGLIDCLDYRESPYLNSVERDPVSKAKLYYDEAIDNFTQYCCCLTKLDSLFELSAIEIRHLIEKVKPETCHFFFGLITKYLLSCLVDSDRFETFCFNENISPFIPEKKADWASLSKTLEESMTSFPSSPINDARKEISDACLRSAALPRGIYELPAPTGSGKTLASLRFALNHAKINEMSRIFYIIPYNTVLHQNSASISSRLKNYDGILEHFGTFISEKKKNSEIDEDEHEHLLLTERWHSDIVFTSMVQFLNTPYKNSLNSNRRLQALANSVIIFDEVQALPRKCQDMFVQLITFLHEQLNCTVLLCTATLPGLDKPTVSLIEDVNLSIWDTVLKRTSIQDKTGKIKSHEDAAKTLVSACNQYGAALLIVNTKSSARGIYEKVLQRCNSNTLCVHLSTTMCPEHRKAQIAVMEKALSKNRPVICVSTMLIEAGVDIDFPFVARSLTGLPSIIQSAGRCNREFKNPGIVGNVEIWNIGGDAPECLEYVKTGQRLTRTTITATREKSPIKGFALDSKEALDYYFAKEKAEDPHDIYYPVENQGRQYLALMFGFNKPALMLIRDNPTEINPINDKMILKQPFATIGELFNVIDDETFCAIAPYSKGKTIIKRLSSGKQSLRSQQRDLRRAQAYSVPIRYEDLGNYVSRGKIIYDSNLNIYYINESIYSSQLGANFK